MTVTGVPVFLGKHVRAIHFGETERIFVALDFGRSDRNGFPEQSPSRYLAKRGIGTLSIMLSENSWYLTPENDALRHALDAHCRGARDVRAMGVSMGGFGAVLLSKALHLKKALLISPQYSIFRSRAPWDRRRNRISAKFSEAWDDLDQGVKPDLSGMMIYDPRRRPDVHHIRALGRVLPDMKIAAVPFGGHPAHVNLVGRSGFRLLIDLLHNDGSMTTWLNDYRRKERENNAVYLRGMTDYLDLREQRKLRE
ncbi:MAG: hypothetical protein DI616_12140 [Paracoccus denitrificans]|uniref:Alpha/beta hydrolase n=1 Tax=Paracoccus denitrificans TaxID=266 RepID=A0A533I840_PARDE|nr:MAG: hypothetical protein DI616_12140 [Paracoccus denitrificans]